MAYTDWGLESGNGSTLLAFVEDEIGAGFGGVEVEFPIHVVTELLAQGGHEHIFKSHTRTIGLASHFFHILREPLILWK